ncbi:unnamed protein product, partial [marine sediment metagenome]
YVQHYSHVIWDISDKKVNKENLESAFKLFCKKETGGRLKCL